MQARSIDVRTQFRVRPVYRYTGERAEKAGSNKIAIPEKNEKGKKSEWQIGRWPAMLVQNTGMSISVWPSQWARSSSSGYECAGL